MVSLTDHYIGRILDHLECAGEMGRTLVVFTSDHGDMLGAHGLWGKGLPAYEDVHCVPLIVAHPECRTPGKVSPALQSLADVMPTLCEIAGVDPGDGTQGVSLAAAWVDAQARARDMAMVEFRLSMGPFFQWTFVFERWKLVL